MPKFEKFVHPSSTQVPTVSGYTKAGRFSFNRAAVKQYGLGCKKHCDLYFDKENRLIGFKFLAAVSNGSVKVQNYNQNLSVAARAFCTHYGISLDDIKRHEITTDDGMLVIKA